MRPKRAPSNPRIVSQWHEPVSTWTPATVRAALDEHERGRFVQSSRLADACLRDAYIAGDLNRRVRALASRSALPFRVEAGEGDGRKRETARRRCERLWWDVIPEPTLAAILRDTIMMGLAVGRVIWTMTAEEWRPRLCHLPIHGLEWLSWERRWVYTTRDGERLPVTPGDGTWFLHTPHGDRSWMLGAVRQVGLPWLMRLLSTRDFARWCERHGMSVLAIKEPHFATDDVEGEVGTTNADAFYAQVRTGIGSETVLRLPQGATPADGGWDAEWLELTGKTYEGFNSQLRNLTSEIHVALLGQDPAAGSRGGDGELAASRTATEYLASDAESLSTSLRQQVWRPDVAYNVDAEDLDLAAWGRWDTRPQPDMQARATTLDKAADAMTKLAALGVDVAGVLAEFGLPAKKLAPAAAEPAMPAEAGAEPGGAAT